MEEEREAKQQPASAKLAVLQEIAEISKTDPRLVISGSVSQIISERRYANNIVSIREEDLTLVSDIDIATIGFAEKDLERHIDTITKHTGVEIEINPILFNCAYPTSGVNNLAIQTAEVKFGDGETTQQIQFTTPEFLLLTLAEQAPSEKTPAEKIQKKIVLIQEMASFSENRFLEIADNEIRVRHAMNKETFKLWKAGLMQTSKQNGGSWNNLLRTRYEDVSSLVDKTQLFNLLRSPNDLENLDYEEVRKIPNIEKFVKEIRNVNKLS